MRCSMMMTKISSRLKRERDDWWTAYQRKNYDNTTGKGGVGSSGVVSSGGSGGVAAVGAGTGITGQQGPVGVKGPDAIADVKFEVQIVSLDDGYPYGLYCADCGNQFIDGDVVLAGQQRLVGWVGWHTRCLKGILEECPLDEYETIKQKIDNGEDPFE